MIKHLLPGLVAAGCIAGTPVLADDSQAHKASAAVDENKLKEHGSYVNKKGEDVHSPAHTKDGSRPSGATAKCGDGTYSFSKSHRSACSRHNGVAIWL